MEAKKSHLEEAESAKWQYKRDGEIICFGSEMTMPSPEERQNRREDGYEVYIDGKVEDEPKAKKGRRAKDGK